MITNLFYGLLAFACLFLILYLWRKDPEYPVFAWVSATLFFMLGGSLLVTGLYIETGTFTEIETLNETPTNETTTKTYTEVNNFSSISLGLLFILIGMYLAIVPFDLERKKKRKADEEHQVDLPNL